MTPMIDITNGSHPYAERLADDQLRRLTDYVHPDETTDYVRAWIHSMAAELLAARKPFSRRQFIQAMADRDEAQAKVAELTERLADQKADKIADGFGIQGMTIGPDGTTLTGTPTTEDARRLVAAMSAACGKMLADAKAPNYVEFELGPAGHPGYVVHVRRAGGPSPHTLRRDAEAALARANEALDKIAEHVEPDDDESWCDAYGALENIANTIETTGRKIWED